MQTTTLSIDSAIVPNPLGYLIHDTCILFLQTSQGCILHSKPNVTIISWYQSLNVSFPSDFFSDVHILN